MTSRASVTAASARWAENGISIHAKLQAAIPLQHLTLVPSCGQLLAHRCTECTAFSCPQLRTTVKCWPKNPPPAKPPPRPHLLAQNPISDLPLPSSGLAPPNQPCPWHPAPPALLATARSSPSAAATPTLCRAFLEQGPTYGAGKPKAKATDVLSV